MPSYKIDRLSQDIMCQLNEIQRKIKDPRVANGMISIVRIDLTNDLSHCKIYLSSLKGLWAAKKAVEGYNSASGFVKRELARTVKMRQVPQLHFIATDSIEYSAEISKKLNDLMKDENNEQ